MVRSESKRSPPIYVKSLPHVCIFSYIITFVLGHLFIRLEMESVTGVSV